MDNRKFEQLIDMIINEEEDKARALFHDIVVEKSREIYESMMYAEGDMPHGEVGDLLGEIGAEVEREESGMTEEDDEFADIDVDDEDGMGDESDMDMDMGDGEEELEDRVVDLEDKLDMLMAEFEELMGQEGDMGDEEMGDMGDEEQFMEGSNDPEGEEAVEESEALDEEENLEESVQLKKIPGLYDSKIGGDDGQNTKSVALSKPKVTQTGAKAVNFSGESSSGGTQGGLLKPTTKTIPGTYKNAPGGKNFSEKGEAAPKPKHGDDGQNTKSPLGESKKSVKKIIKK
jgi:hypothetical protein